MIDKDIENELLKNLPTPHVIELMTKMAMDVVLHNLSEFAIQFSHDPLMKTVRGDKALECFAKAILSDYKDLKMGKKQ